MPANLDLNLPARAGPPRVAVLMATRNGGPWIAEQLDSLFAQSDVDVTAFIGDDRSVDDTTHLISNHPAAHRITLTVWPEASGSAGKNFRRLFRTTPTESFDYVALSDQDDIWHPRKLAEAISSLQHHAAAGYSCAVQAFWPDGRRNSVAQNPTTRGADFLFEGAGQGCTFVLRSSAFQRVAQACATHEEAVESLHYHDWLIYLVFRASRLPWHFDPRPWIQYRQHAGNEIGARGGLSAIRSRIGRISNGWYLRQIKAAAKLYGLLAPYDVLVDRFVTILETADGVQRRLSLSIFSFRYGRRRLSDRLVLVTVGILGWL